MSLSSTRWSKSRPGSMTTLEGGFVGSNTREFPAGTYFLDMAQPMANAAFYYLEPQSADGFVGWGVLDNYLRNWALTSTRWFIRYSSFVKRPNSRRRTGFLSFGGTESPMSMQYNQTGVRLAQWRSQ